MSNHLPKMQIPAEVLKFIDVCYGNRPSEKLTVAAVGKGIVPVLSLPVPQAKERLRTIKVGRLAGYQISKNTGAEPRVLNNIVIDVRAVSEHYSNDDIYLFSQELFHSLIFLLYPEDICPSYFVFTGRGAQIWWSLKPLHAAVYLKQYRRVTDFLIEKVWEAIERADDINCFAVCEKASRMTSNRPAAATLAVAKPEAAASHTVSRFSGTPMTTTPRFTICCRPSLS